MKSVKISLIALSLLVGANLNAQEAKIMNTKLVPIQKMEATHIVNRKELEAKKRKSHDLNKVQDLNKISLEPAKN